MSSPTQRTLELMRDRHYLAAIVEKWNPHAPRGDGGMGIRQDLFGLLDVLAVRDSEVIGIQTTSRGCMRDHEIKIREHPNLPRIIASGMRVVLHGWFKQRGRWHVKEVDIL